MPVEKGDVWWGPAPHKSAPSYRPWLVVSDDSHPFARNECNLCSADNPTASAGHFDSGRRVGSRRLTEIRLRLTVYVATMKHRDFDDQQGELSDEIVDAAVRALHEYTATSG